MSADAFTADVGQQIDPQGRVTYDFRDAHIKANGVDLNAGETGSPPNDRRVRWIRASDGGRVAELYAYEDGAFIELIQRAATADDSRDALIAATFDKADDSCLVQAQAFHVARGISQRRIVDDYGRSEFVQIPAGVLDGVRLDFGFVDCVFAGANISTPYTNAFHRLGVLNLRCVLLACGQRSDGRWETYASSQGVGATDRFVVAATSTNLTPAAGVTVRVYWLAIA